MVTKELIDYIKTESAKGTVWEDIKKKLVTNGWQANDVDEAQKVITQLAKTQSAMQPPLESTKPAMASQPTALQTPPATAPMQQQAKPIQPMQPASSPQNAFKPSQPINFTVPTTSPISPSTPPQISKPAQPMQPTTPPVMAPKQPIPSLNINAKPMQPMQSMYSRPPISGTQSPTLGATAPTKKHKLLVPIILVIFLALIAGGATYLYMTGYFSKSLTPVDETSLTDQNIVNPITINTTPTPPESETGQPPAEATPPVEETPAQQPPASLQDEVVKSTVLEINPAAATFYQQNSSSYIGFCSTSSVSNARINLKLTNKGDFICHATAMGYSMSARLEAGNYFCIDATGFKDIIPTYTPNTRCVQ